MGIPSESFLAGAPVDLEKIKAEIDMKEEEEEMRDIVGSESNVNRDSAAETERMIDEENNAMQLQAEYERRYQSIRQPRG
mmetsp:Transcript_27005/g.88308  ORF Transcript_27005/g.88308 Transcript_27005/m.88308 type:complete len:80 (-) Transcript_27005:40-279(-)